MQRINSETISKYDRSGMIEMIQSVPEQVRDGWDRAEGMLPEAPSGNGRLIICGMGGSAIGASLVRDLAGAEHPIDLERGYLLPPSAGRGSTVICISYSGNTEEILSLFREAKERECSMGVITSGGMLEREARDAGARAIVVRGGLPPRAAIGYLFSPLVRILSGWGWIEEGSADMESLAGSLEDALEMISPESDQNPAAVLSEKLYGKIPLIYSGGSLMSSVPYRWKCQFNENSKMMAFSNCFPELGHNEVMGWDSPRDILERLAVVILADSDDHPRISKRIEITSSLLEEEGIEPITIDTGSWFGQSGLPRIERMICAVALGDMTSAYLAIRRGIDPVPIGRIETVKKKLRQE